MNLNAYDTTVGKPFKIMDNVAMTIKTLALLGGLTPSQNTGVFLIDYGNGADLPVFMFPLSIFTHDRKPITVVDIRPYTNKSGSIINHADYTLMTLCAYYQQGLHTNDYSKVKSGRIIAARGFARSLANRLGHQAGLDDKERLKLTAILGIFFVCLMENKSQSWEFVAGNVLKQALELDARDINSVAESVGFISNMEELLEAIKKQPDLYKLKMISLKELVTVMGTISFASMGKQIIGAAVEHVPLFTALCYVTLTNTNYNKTSLASEIEVKRNEKLALAFIQGVNANYSPNR